MTSLLDVGVAGSILADSQWSFVAVGWTVSAGALFGYAVLTIVRGKRLSRAVDPEERRWS